jgi:hypothetical protein
MEPPSTGVAVFQPLEQIGEHERPEVVIFFTDADRLSALVFLAYFDDPMAEGVVVTRFASACGAVATLPLRHARQGEMKALWGMHDIAARARLPQELMTMAMPMALAERMHGHIQSSFLQTSTWARLTQRATATSLSKGLP